MKRKITRVRPDGSKEIVEIDDEAPAHHKHELDAKKKGDPPAKQYLDRMASQGHGGDTELAHVNPWEEALLKRLGGAGTRNPHTGLKQFLPASSDVSQWYQDILGRAPDPGGLQYWTTYGDTPDENADPLAAFRAAAQAEIAARPATTGTAAIGMVSPTGAVVGPGEQGFVAPASWTTPTATTPAQAVPTTEQIAEYLRNAGLMTTPITPTAAITAPTSNLPADNINIPLDIMPTSSSASTSYSGLPASYQDELLKSLMPQLNTAITDMPGNIDKYTGEALGSYQQMMQNALRKNIPQAIAQLANRGIISSTEGNKILAEVMSNAATDASTKGYTTAMQAALQKAGMPSILASMADLGKSNTSSSASYQEDPTVMYRTLASTIQAMMG
jgi:hypothetical protein